MPSIKQRLNAAIDTYKEERDKQTRAEIEQIKAKARKINAKEKRIWNSIRDKASRNGIKVKRQGFAVVFPNGTVAQITGRAMEILDATIKVKKNRTIRKQRMYN